MQITRQLKNSKTLTIAGSGGRVDFLLDGELVAKLYAISTYGRVPANAPAGFGGVMPINGDTSKLLMLTTDECSAIDCFFAAERANNTALLAADKKRVAEQKAKAAAYDEMYNEGGEGYNPHRV